MSAYATPRAPSPRRSRELASARLILATLLATTLLTGCPEGREPHSPPETPPDPRNATYLLDGVAVDLVDGAANLPLGPGSSGRVITRIFGEPTLGDLDADGIDDAVLILTRDTAGSGTFYYVAAAIASPNGHSGTTGILLGDRIEIQGVLVRGGKASVRFLTRGEGESFADAPTTQRTRDFIYDTESQEMVEVAHEFEGEADPERMTLGMKTWTWIKTEYNNDTTKEPVQKDAFTLTFADGRVQGTTDCNRFSGAYSVDGHKIHFDDKVAMTRMFCPDSQETEFVAMLLETRSYLFTSQGRLVLELKYDSGGMHFR